MRYFYVIPAEFFRSRLVPAISACFRARSFAPAQPLALELADAATRFYHQGAQDSGPPVLMQIQSGIRFRVDLWRMLVAESLLFSCVELPELETPLDSFAAAMKQPLGLTRETYSPLQRAILGSQELRFGPICYRVDHVSWNDESDIQFVVEALAGVQSAGWRAADLPGPEADEELEYIQEWFPRLVDLYRRAADARWIIVCESL